jgi:hypothetical protein
VIRYNGAAKPCPSGSYDDVDDLAFAVQAATPKPTTQVSSFTLIARFAALME